VRGTVTAQDNASKATRPLSEGDKITQGVTVITGKSRDSSVVLVFSNGAKVNLAADSILNIEEYLTESSKEQIDVATLVAEPNSSSTKLHLAQGELVGNVVKLNKDRGSQFIVQTPVGAAGIRGTTFRVVFRPDPANPGHYTFSVSKPEGNVDVTTQNATGAVSVPVAVGDNHEIVVDVQATVNPTTGQITVTAPPQFITQSIPPATTAIISTAAVHHRLLWMHPFMDGNGRVARLMSHAMMLEMLDTGAVWSVARGLARNVQQYKRLLANCDQPHRNDLDGRGALSEEALAEFTRFFLTVSIDQVNFMESLIQPDRLRTRILLWAEEEIRLGHLPPNSGSILGAVLYRGELPRGGAGAVAGTGERQARRVVSALLHREVLVSESSRAPLRLAFPAALASRWMPGLFPEKAPDDGV